MRVFLDDRRPAPEGWTLVRWPEEAIALLEGGCSFGPPGVDTTESRSSGTAPLTASLDMPPHLDSERACLRRKDWRVRYWSVEGADRCGLMARRSHHRALDDARNTVRMLRGFVGGRDTL